MNEGIRLGKCRGRLELLSCAFLENNLFQHEPFQHVFNYNQTETNISDRAQIKYLWLKCDTFQHILKGGNAFVETITSVWGVQTAFVQKLRQCLYNVQGIFIYVMIQR